MLSYRVLAIQPLLLMLALTQQVDQETPAIAFLKIQKRIATAQSIKLRYDVSDSEDSHPETVGDCGMRRSGSWGLLLFKGDRFRIEEWWCASANLRASISVSDGKQTRSGGFGRVAGEAPQEKPLWDPKVVDTPKNIGRSLQLSLALHGPTRLKFALDAALEQPSVERKVDNLPEKIDPRISDMKWDSDDKRGKCFSFSLTSDEGETTWKFRIWFDPTTFVLRKVVESWKPPKSDEWRHRYIEYYEYEINGDVPETRFALPP